MKIIRNLLLTLIISLCAVALINARSVNASSVELKAGREISVTGITGNLNNVNIKFEFTTSINLDGVNNALLVGLMSSDGTVLTDTRYVVSATNSGVFDSDGVAIVFEQSMPTIGKRSGNTYTIETRDFTIINSSKNIAKLVIVGQKGTLINSEVTVSEVKYGVKFGSSDTVYYSYNQTISAPSTKEYSYDINGHTEFTTWTGNDSVVFTSGVKATKDITYTGSGNKVNHTWTNVSEVAATNTKDGVKAHQECSVCGAKRLSSSSTALASDADLKIPAIVHSHSYKATFNWTNATTPGSKPSVTYKCSDTTCNDTHVMSASEITVTEKAGSRVNPTYTTAGSVTYTATCTYQGVKATDEKTYTLPMLTHTLVHHKASPATCDQDGTIEYWSCSDCNKLFSDEYGTNEITSTVEKAHHTLTKVPAVTATPSRNGNIEYYHCSVCEKNFIDSKGKTIATDVTIVYSENLTYYPEVPATCESDGTKAHYHSELNNKDYKDAACTIEITDLVIPKYHEFIYMSAVEATCTKNGNIEYYHCENCNKNFDDQGNELSDVTIVDGHSAVFYNAKTATCTKDGNVEYYHCNKCNKNYKDAACTKEITNVVIKSNGHNYEDGRCTVCGASDPSYSFFDKILGIFGCNSSISSIGIIGVLSISVVFLKRKKKQLE